MAGARLVDAAMRERSAITSLKSKFPFHCVRNGMHSSYPRLLRRLSPHEPGLRPTVQELNDFSDLEAVMLMEQHIGFGRRFIEHITPNSHLSYTKS